MHAVSTVEAYDPAEDARLPRADFPTLLIYAAATTTNSTMCVVADTPSATRSRPSGRGIPLR